MPRRAPKQQGRAAAIAALVWLLALLPLTPAAAGSPLLRPSIDTESPLLRSTIDDSVVAAPKPVAGARVRQAPLPAATSARPSSPAVSPSASPAPVAVGEDVIAPPALAAATAPSQAPTGEDAIGRPSQDAAEAAGLHLAVTLNSQPAGKIIAFTDLGGGRLAAARRDLEEVGIRPPGGGAPDQAIPLDGIPDFAYIYDAPAQRVDIVLSDENRIPNVYDARGDKGGPDVARADYGAVLNYALFAAGSADDSALDEPEFTGVNATLDARLFTPMGVLSQSGIVGETVGNQWADEAPGYLRLDTTYTYDDQDNLIRYRVGDVISGGPIWSRPIRLGGAQAQRTFSLRPDLVTQSLPSYSGSAAVPSTVDVYVNNAKAYSKEVGAGPFQINNLPTVNGAGNARVVVRDAAGRESEQSLSFYASPTLLKPGLVDFSAEAGYARQDYALDSAGYGDKPLITGSIKVGIDEGITAEAHAEGGDGLGNAGAGLVMQVGSLGIASAAVSASTRDGKTGIQLHGSFDTRLGTIPVNLRSQRALDDYEDLASLTSYYSLNGLRGFSSHASILSFEPPRAVDSVGFNIPIDFDESSIGFNFIHYESRDGDVSNLISATYSRPLIEKTTLSVTGYADLDDLNTSAVYVGVNMALDGNVSLTAGANRRGQDYGASVEAGKSVSQEPGSWGWHVRDYEGRNPYRSADVSYRLAAAKVKGGVRQETQAVRGTLEVEGAVATLGDGVYTSNRIDDGFAVVNAGAPGITVLRENNVIGETGEDGTLLVPNLNSYHRNKLDIDPMGLPINAKVEETTKRVTPAFRSGVYVDFNVESEAPSAIVVLTDAAGNFLELGSEVTLEGASEPFMVGYDGQTYITGLGPRNTLIVKRGATSCRVSFDFQPQSEIQQTIGPEVCQ